MVEIKLLYTKSDYRIYSLLLSKIGYDKVIDPILIKNKVITNDIYKEYPNNILLNIEVIKEMKKEIEKGNNRILFILKDLNINKISNLVKIIESYLNEMELNFYLFYENQEGEIYIENVKSIKIDIC
jgi:hypothetical protein